MIYFQPLITRAAKQGMQSHAVLAVDESHYSQITTPRATVDGSSTAARILALINLHINGTAEPKWGCTFSPLKEHGQFSKIFHISLCAKGRKEYIPIAKATTPMLKIIGG